MIYLYCVLLDEVACWSVGVESTVMSTVTVAIFGLGPWATEHFFWSPPTTDLVLPSSRFIFWTRYSNVTRYIAVLLISMFFPQKSSNQIWGRVVFLDTVIESVLCLPLCITNFYKNQLFDVFLFFGAVIRLWLFKIDFSTFLFLEILENFCSVSLLRTVLHRYEDFLSSSPKSSFTLPSPCLWSVLPFFCDKHGKPEFGPITVILLNSLWTIWKEKNCFSQFWRNPSRKEEMGEELFSQRERGGRSCWSKMRFSKWIHCFPSEAVLGDPLCICRFWLFFKHWTALLFGTSHSRFVKLCWPLWCVSMKLKRKSPAADHDLSGLHDINLNLF